MLATIPINLCLHMMHLSIARDTFETHLVGTELLQYHILYISELYCVINCIYIPCGGL
jgi:hypothetical protein